MSEADPEPTKEQDKTAAVPRPIKKGRSVTAQKMVWEVESAASKGESNTEMPNFP